MEDLVVAEHGRPRGGRAWKTSWWQSMEDMMVGQSMESVAEHGRPDGGAEHGIGGRACKTSCWQSMEDSLMVKHRRIHIEEQRIRCKAVPAEYHGMSKALKPPSPSLFLSLLLSLS